MARCWVLRKRAGLVLLSLVVCAVRMLAAAGGVGSSLFLGLLLRSWFWVRLVVLSPAWWGEGGVGRSGVVGVVGGSGRWASNRSAGCVGQVFRGLVLAFRWGRR